MRPVKAPPNLLQQAKETAERWLATGDTRSAVLWREWLAIMDAGAWRKVPGHTRHAQQLRQASPLVTALPEPVRDHILGQVQSLKRGLVLSSTPGEPPCGPAARKAP